MWETKLSDFEVEKGSEESKQSAKTGQEASNMNIQTLFPCIYYITACPYQPEQL